MKGNNTIFIFIIITLQYLENLVYVIKQEKVNRYNYQKIEYCVIFVGDIVYFERLKILIKSIKIMSVYKCVEL